jgi:flavin-dependent dehydrogenase
VRRLDHAAGARGARTRSPAVPHRPDLSADHRLRVGQIGSSHVVDTRYDRPVSFGIRRCEFDHYLLERSGARLLLGDGVTRIRRSGASWIINEAVSAPLLVGAGGHFCPVAAMVNGPTPRATLVSAQEAEFAVDRADVAIAPERPELYFSQDLAGYGWCFRKGNYLNVGYGRVDAHALPADSASFVSFLRTIGRLPRDLSWRWRGHAYLLAGGFARKAVDDGVLLIGDAAGLAYPQSGEGIRPAIESGLLAARAIAEARGRYTRERLSAYERSLRRRFGSGLAARGLARVVPPRLARALAPQLFRSEWLVRHLVLDRWFLHASEPALP